MIPESSEQYYFNHPTTTKQKINNRVLKDALSGREPVLEAGGDMRRDRRANLCEALLKCFAVQTGTEILQVAV